jgi:hypothetical protein
MKQLIESRAKVLEAEARERVLDKEIKLEKLKLINREWVGLTDEEVAELHHEIKVQLMGTYKTEDIYRAIEAKLKEKNT